MGVPPFMGVIQYISDSTVIDELETLARTHQCVLGNIMRFTDDRQLTHFDIRDNADSPRIHFRLRRQHRGTGFELGTLLPLPPGHVIGAPAVYVPFTAISDVIGFLQGRFPPRMMPPAAAGRPHPPHAAAGPGMRQTFQMVRVPYTRPLAACADRRVVPFWTELTVLLFK